MQIYITAFLLLSARPLPPLAFSIPLSPSFVFPVTYLGDPSSFARGANIHPLSSLVSYQLFSPYYLTHPEGTPQITLHIYIDDINNMAVPSDTVILIKFTPLFSSMYDLNRILNLFFLRIH